MSKRILVVEDQPDNRQIIRDMLAPTDYEITEVESGEEALTVRWFQFLRQSQRVAPHDRLQRKLIIEAHFAGRKSLM